jgi:hypothetical protein
MSFDNTATFAVTPERFIVRLLDCHTLEVVFPSADGPRHAIFDLTGLEKEIENFPRAKKALAPNKAKRRDPPSEMLVKLNV